MPKKLQIFIGGMAVIAMVLVWQFTRFIHTAALGGPTLSQGASISSADDDPDHDGLNTIQEALWNTDPYDPDTDSDGFKDGEEVASGHNPLVAGPDDLINDENLTDKLSNLTVAGMAAGALNPESDTYAQSLGDIGDSISDSAKYLFDQQIDPSLVKVSGKGETAVVQYITAVTPVLVDFSALLNTQYANIIDNLNTIGDKGYSDPSVHDSFSQAADQYDKFLAQGIAIQAPAEAQSQHAQLLSLIQQMRDISKAIANGDKDPVKGAFALSAFGDSFNTYLDMINSFLTIKATK
ncbi:MAG TPA: hypothetical protein VG941_01710 [Candidatus Paceibacterota bacterium]|nr:hypothetical protein [Candidatus Paceibacterota bacterium]